VNPRYITRLDQIDDLDLCLKRGEREQIEQVERVFPFRSNNYYLSLIDWNDRDDPIRKIVIPDPEELNENGLLDPSFEQNYTVVPGLQHKYPQTALLLVSNTCGGVCRFCFRKRLFLGRAPEVVSDIPLCMEYIRSHPEITNVLLTGGDPLTLATRDLENIVHQLREIEHVQIIRIGSKMPAYNPYRILNDPSLSDMIRRYSTDRKRIYIMAHFNHSRELTDVAVQALHQLQGAGAIVVHQTPLISGINASSAALADLFRRLSFIGVSPYYVFQCRPTIGNRLFSIPVEKSYTIVQNAFMRCSGLAKRARFIMSHTTGKIEVVGSTREHTFMKYHQAAHRKDLGRFMVFRKNPEATWFDDYIHHLTDFIPRKHWIF
jgi:lysine 2,3-aminomutase